MRRNHGFTLAEVLVSLVISSIVLLAVGSVFIGVQNSYERLARSQSSIDANRTAMAYIERQVRMAGYGIDPTLAFDFTTAIPSGTNRNDGAIDADTGAPSVTGPALVTDDLVLRYRDPNWTRRGNVNAAGDSISLDTNSTKWGLSLRAGRRLLVTCPAAGGFSVYRVTNDITPTTTGAQTVVRIATAPFPTTAQPACLTQTGALLPYVTLLQERRIRIRNVGGRPFLVAYDVLSANGNSDYDPIAADVEEFQVAYLMNPQPSNSNVTPAVAVVGGNWILGDTTPAVQTDLPSPAAAAPSYEDAYDTAARYTANPANIRSVRVSIVTRSRSARPNAQESRPYSLESNARTAPPLDGFFRLLSTTTIRAPNMMSRSSFTPLQVRARANADANYNGG